MTKRGRGRPIGASPYAEQIAAIFADGSQHYGSEITRRTGIPPGTIYPLLRRMEERGIFESKWEVTKDGLPPRKLYKLKDTETIDTSKEEG